MPDPQQQPIYLDDNGNPIAKSVDVYVDENGNPIKPKHGILDADPDGDVMVENVKAGIRNIPKLALGAAEGVNDLRNGAVSSVLHPIDTATGLYHSLVDAAKDPKGTIQRANDYMSDPQHFARVATQVALPVVLPGAEGIASDVAEAAPKAAAATKQAVRAVAHAPRAAAGFVADSPLAQAAIARGTSAAIGAKEFGPLGGLWGFGSGAALKPLVGDVAARASLTASDYLKAGFNPDEVSLMRADGMSKGDIASAVRAELKRQKSVGQRQAILDQLGADDGPAKAHVTDLNAQAKAASAHHIDVSDLFKDDGGPSYVGDLKDFSVVDDGAPYEHAIDDAKRAVENNGSGESAASQEALSRARGMKSRGESYAVFDRSGNMRPLIGPDAVDYVPKKGETYGIQTPDGFRTLTDNGGKVGNAALSPQLSSLNLQWGQDLATNQRLGVPDEYTITEDPEGADMMEHISKAQRQAINDRMKQLAKDAAAAKKPLLKPVWKDGKLQLP